jgi:hypothetical protein
MPSKSKSKAEAWLLSGEPTSGALAWDRAPVSAKAPRPSPNVRAAAVALVSNLEVVQLARVRKVESLLAQLEQAERTPRATRKRKHG